LFHAAEIKPRNDLTGEKISWKTANKNLKSPDAAKPDEFIGVAW
jgi:hypothetical protein